MMRELILKKKQELQEMFRQFFPDQEILHKLVALLVQFHLSQLFVNGVVTLLPLHIQLQLWDELVDASV